MELEKFKCNCMEWGMFVSLEPSIRTHNGTCICVMGSLKKKLQLRIWAPRVVVWHLGDLMSLRGFSKFPVSRPHFHNWNLDVWSCHSNSQLMFTWIVWKWVNVGWGGYRNDFRFFVIAIEQFLIHYVSLILHLIFMWYHISIPDSWNHMLSHLVNPSNLHPINSIWLPKLIP